MFGLDALEIGVLVVFVAIIVLFALNMGKNKDQEETRDRQS
jgi:hypothetical protein